MIPSYGTHRPTPKTNARYLFVASQIRHHNLEVIFLNTDGNKLRGFTNNTTEGQGYIIKKREKTHLMPTKAHIISIR